MESFLKRKLSDDDSKSTKKMNREICPHNIKCYRRNPHHFREYDHPHLDKLLETGKPYEVPKDYPQDEKVLFEQLDILGDLRYPKSQNPKVEVPVTDIPSSSKSSPNENYRSSVKNKNTSFVPNKSGQSSNTSISSKPMLERLKENAPYNLFYSTIPDSPTTLNQKFSITFKDLLCPSLGELKCSLQINFIIDIGWLMEQYKAMGQDKKPLTIIYGDEFPDMKKYIQLACPNVTDHLVQMTTPYGIHHSKIGIYVYNDNSLRIVVSTANLYYEDWNYYSQGLWISDACPKLSDDKPDRMGESTTFFKSTLISYLHTYKIPQLEEWIKYVKRADFSGIPVCLVTSAPGNYTMLSASEPIHSHLLQVSRLLGKHCSLPKKDSPDSEGPLSWGIIAQASSLGSMGKSASEWLRHTLLGALERHDRNSLTTNSNATISIIYPAALDVIKSYYGVKGGGCLPYQKEVNDKQKWLKDYLHCWRADSTGRTRAMPHIKSYCRVSPCCTKLAYFLLTSANISKSAWGQKLSRKGSSYVRSYEVGVLFLPKFFEESYFQIQDIEGRGEEGNLFPLIYDLPLISYGENDEPWCN